MLMFARLPPQNYLGDALKYVFYIGWTKTYLFGFEIIYFEELRTKPEISSRYLSFGRDEAWSGAHSWHKNWDGDWHYTNLDGFQKEACSESRLSQMTTAQMEISAWSFFWKPQNPKIRILRPENIGFYGKTDKTKYFRATPSKSIRAKTI